MIGFAKLVGDLIDGLMQVALYFGLAAAISTLIFVMVAILAMIQLKITQQAETRR